jgi:hypothetical protein
MGLFSCCVSPPAVEAHDRPPQPPPEKSIDVEAQRPVPKAAAPPPDPPTTTSSETPREGTWSQSLGKLNQSEAAVVQHTLHKASLVTGAWNKPLDMGSLSSWPWAYGPEENTHIVHEGENDSLSAGRWPYRIRVHILRDSLQPYLEQLVQKLERLSSTRCLLWHSL